MTDPAPAEPRWHRNARVGAAVEAALRELGAAASYGDVRAWLGGQSLDCSEQCYTKHHRRLFAVGAARPPPAVDGGPGADPPALAPVAVPADADRLSDFIRFAVAVEAAGGVAKARAYLGVIGRLGEVL